MTDIFNWYYTITKFYGTILKRKYTAQRLNLATTQIFSSKPSTPKDSEEDNSSKKPRPTKPHDQDTNNSEEDSSDDHRHHKKDDDDCNSLKTIIKKAIKYNCSGE